MKNITKTLGILPWLLIVFVVHAWCIEPGDSIPDFSIRTFDGRVVSTSSLEGRPVMLVFWNTWCASCRRELPRIDRLAAEFGPQGLELLAINTGFNDSESKARAFWQKSGYLFPFAFDHRFDVGQAFAIRGVPTIFLIDDKGVVRYKQAVIPPNMDVQFKRLKLE